MVGYLGREDLTAKVMHDGWYTTGDIAKVDEEGFITIHGSVYPGSQRLAERWFPMDLLKKPSILAAEADTQVLAVTAIPDEIKGEQLAVLHTLDEATIPTLLEKVMASGLPKLFLPRKDYFIQVEAIPVLGTGKLDLQTLKQVALEKLGKKQPAP